MLNSILESTVSTVSLTSILLCSLCSIVLGFLISLIHKVTSKYSKNFLITIAILPLLVQIVIIMVNGNLGTSVAIVGAFSLVRFRSLPGTSKEILSVFFAMVVGLMTGMGYLFFAVIMTIISCILLFVLNKVRIFDKNKYEKILTITIPEDLDYTNVFDDIFKNYTKKIELERVKTINMGSLFELRYRVILNKDINEKKFIDDLRIRNGNLKIILTHPIEESDL